MSDMRYIENFSALEYIVLGGLIFFIIILVVFLVPGIFQMRNLQKIAKEKKRKKLLLHHITLQKEIEDQIEQEIQEEEEKRQKKEPKV